MSHHYPLGSCNRVRVFEINKQEVVHGKREGRCGARIRRDEKKCRYCGTTRR